MRRLTSFLPVHGDRAGLRDAFREPPGLWLPASEEVGDDRWTLTVRGAGLARKVTARVGQPWASSNTLWRSLSWAPNREPTSEEMPPRLLPSFDGELGLVTADSGVSLVLEGSYQPPGGQLGAALDGLALHRVARGTVDRLIADIAALLVEASVTAATPDQKVAPDH